MMKLSVVNPQFKSIFDFINFGLMPDTSANIFDHAQIYKFIYYNLIFDSQKPGSPLLTGILLFKATGLRLKCDHTIVANFYANFMRGWFDVYCYKKECLPALSVNI